MRYLVLFLLIAGCSDQKSDERVFDDDYVLVEFASKLEEEYPHEHKEEKRHEKDPYHP